MSTTTTTTNDGKKRLKIADQDMDLDAELKKFEDAERARLGLDGKIDHWVEDMVGKGFKKSERAKVTLLIGGLTLAHDFLIAASCRRSSWSFSACA